MGFKARMDPSTPMLCSHLCVMILRINSVYPGQGPRFTPKATFGVTARCHLRDGCVRDIFYIDMTRHHFPSLQQLIRKKRQLINRVKCSFVLGLCSEIQAKLYGPNHTKNASEAINDSKTVTLNLD